MKNALKDNPSCKMHERCILCGCQELTLKYLINGFHLVRCGSCSLLFVAERLSREQLDNYSKSQVAGESEYTYTDQDNNDNLNFYYDKLASLINKRIPKGRILDVGCSAGYFLDRMPGWERHGIEPVASQAEKAKQRCGGNIHTGTLEDYRCPEGYFDVITLQDSLDHMTDPSGAVRKCRSILRANGLLVVKVHDISCLYAKISGRRFYALIPPFHLCYFSRANLFKLLGLAGFKVDQYSYMDQKLFLKTIFFRLSQNNSKSIFYKLFTMINTSPFKDLTVKKNPYDIITVLASKASAGKGEY